MDDKIKTRLDALENLRNGAWRDFDTLRSYEWKIGISIWTALAAFIAIVLTGRINIHIPWTVFVLGIIIIILHAVFINGIAKQAEVDRAKQFFYEKIIRSTLNLEIPDKLQSKIDKFMIKQEQRDNYKCLRFLHWSIFFQISITIILVALTVLTVFMVAG